MAISTLSTPLNPDGTAKQLKPGDPGYIAPPAQTVPLQSPVAGSTVALSKEALGGAAAQTPVQPPNVTAGNTAILAKAQSDVLNQPAVTPLAAKTEQVTMDWLNKPQGEFDPNKYKQQRMEKAQSDWANAFEAQRQQYGNISGSGLLQQNMLQNALQHNVDQAALESNIDQENYQRYVDSLGKAIAAGQTGTQQSENVFSQRLANLGNVRAMAEGEASRQVAKEESALDRALKVSMQGTDIQGQKDITELQGKIQSGQQVDAREFQAAQSALDRAQQLAVQRNDVQAQKDITALKAQLDQQAATIQRQFESGENALNRAQQLTVLKEDQIGQRALAELQGKIQSGQQLSERDFKASQSALDRAQQMAIQSNDIKAQKDVLNMQAEINRAAADAQRKFDSGQAELNRLQQMNVLAKDQQGAQELARLQGMIAEGQQLRAQDFQGLQASLERQQAVALQSNDIMAQRQLVEQKAAIDKAAADAQRAFESQENVLNRAQQLTVLKADQEGQRAIAELQNQFDTGKLLKSQDFQSAQAALDRAQQVALQSGDIQGQKDIAKMKSDLDAQMQKKQQEFQAAERVATQSWQTGEAIAERDAAKAAQYFDAEQKKLLQAGDIQGQKVLADMKFKMDMALQTQSMRQEEKMAKLNNDYLTAQKNGDVTRQKQILDFTYQQDMAKIAQEQGFEIAKTKLQSQIQAALQANDFAHAEAMQKALFVQQSAESAKDRQLQQASLDLQAKGIDLQEVERNYAMLEGQVKAGLIDKSVLTDYLGKITESAGVKLTPPDEFAATRKADEEFAALQREFARTHTGMADSSGKLTEAGQKAFNEFYNKSMYGESPATSEEAISQKAAEAVQSPEKYAELLKDETVKEWKPELSYDSRGLFKADQRYIKNAPPKGTIFKYGGKAYEVMSDKKMNTSGEDADEFTVRDLKDNTVKTVKAVAVGMPGTAGYGSKLAIYGI